MLNGLISEKTFTSVVLEEPELMKCTDELGNTEHYLLSAEALNFLYGKMKVSYQVSKTLFKTDKELWDNMIQKTLYENHDIKGLSKYRYMLIDNKGIFSIYEPDFDDVTAQYDIFDKVFKEARRCINVAGTIQLALSHKESEDSDNASLLLVDLNPVKGCYTAYNGIFYNGLVIIMSTPIIEANTFYEFITGFDPVVEDSMSQKFYPNVLRMYEEDADTSTEISLREIIDVLKKSKCEITLDNNKMIDNLSLTGSMGLIAYINSYNTPYKSLAKQEFLKKSLTYGGYTIEEFLKILGDNLFDARNAIDATLLSDFLTPCFNQRTDKNIVDEFKE